MLSVIIETTIIIVIKVMESFLFPAHPSSPEFFWGMALIWWNRDCGWLKINK
jgi:hypothetical protein